jgi:putative transposase
MLEKDNYVMKKKFTEEEIAFFLKQAEYGTPVAKVIRNMGISEQPFYRWKKRYGGLGMSELRRLKQLEEENRKLKQMVLKEKFTGHHPFQCRLQRHRFSLSLFKEEINWFDLLPQN